jgi:hypothetical protein
MRTLHLVPVLLALSGVATAYDQAEVPLEEPAFGSEGAAEKPEIPGLGKDVEPLALAVIGIGSETRVNGAYEVDRKSGEIIDGLGAIGLRREKPTHRGVTSGLVLLFAGTDPLAAHDGRFMGGIALAQAAWQGVIPLYDLRLSGGWSSERKGLLKADAILGIIHVAVSHDHEIDNFRLGGAVDGPPGLIPARFGIDRVFSYRDSQRVLATETWLELGVPVHEGVFLAGNAAYTFDAIDANGHEDNNWSGWIGIGVRW